jgi:outer membrane protein OmpA-like peptidoglycan-associated protein
MNERDVFAALAGVLVAACASKGTIVLLPESDGRATAVSVKQGDEEIVLDKPYAAANATWRGPAEYQSTPQEIESRFGSTIAARPMRAETFVLYFVEGKDELTEESRRQFDQVLSEVARRPVPDVLVVGHTDAAGSDEINDALGMQRAQTVRTALIAVGIPAADIQAISRGKRAPAVPTADGVAESRNRRVEIVIR